MRTGARSARDPARSSVAGSASEPDADPARRAPWEWTDDTEMACSVVAGLAAGGRIDRNRLALAFARRCGPYPGGTGRAR